MKSRAQETSSLHNYEGYCSVFNHVYELLGYVGCMSSHSIHCRYPGCGNNYVQLFAVHSCENEANGMSRIANVPQVPNSELAVHCSEGKSHEQSSSGKYPNTELQRSIQISSKINRKFGRRVPSRFHGAGWSL